MTIYEGRVKKVAVFCPACYGVLYRSFAEIDGGDGYLLWCVCADCEERGLGKEVRVVIAHCACSQLWVWRVSDVSELPALSVLRRETCVVCEPVQKPEWQLADVIADVMLEDIAPR